MKKNNKGFSYVEMIIVIGIMALVVTITGLSINLVSRTNVQKAADKYQSALNNARTTALTKGNAVSYFHMMKKDGDLYVATGDRDALGVKWEKICDGPISFQLTLQYSGGFAVVPVNEGEKVTFHFAQGTGGLMNNVNTLMSVDTVYIANFNYKNKTASVKVDGVTGKATRE